jgi:hypothetical protein
MKIRNTAALGVLSLVLASAGSAYAGTVTTINDTNAADLANALTTGGAGGITITGETLSSNSNGGNASAGLFSTVGTNNYGLQGSGIVISNGDAATDGTSGPVIDNLSVEYGAPATASQTSLLNQVASASSFNDVTELDITFVAGPTTTHVFFNTVFASAEYPVFVGQFIDGFGLFLNGTNIAFAGGNPVNIDNPGMVNTEFPNNGGGNDGTAFQTTPLQGVLVENGSAVITYGGDVVPGSTNTLTFIVADANDDRLDTAAFIQGLGNAPPPIGTPEPSTWAMMLMGFVGLGYFARRKGIKLRASAA